MSQRGVKLFLDEMQKDPGLRAGFNLMIARLAQGRGFDVTEADIGENFSASFKPSAAPPAGRPKTDFSKLNPVMTTQAIGEEDFKGQDPNRAPPSVTCAIGEEDGKPAPGNGPDQKSSVTCAMGEEDKKPAPPKDGPRATTLALGEEGDRIRKPGVGTGGGGGISRIGEDAEDTPPRREPQITSAALGEEDGRKPNTVKRYIIPREDGNGNTGPDVTSMALGEEEPKKKKPGAPKP
jgi:hypothetical protein